MVGVEADRPKTYGVVGVLRHDRLLFLGGVAIVPEDVARVLGELVLPDVLTVLPQVDEPAFSREFVHELFERFPGYEHSGGGYHLSVRFELLEECVPDEGGRAPLIGVEVLHYGTVEPDGLGGIVATHHHQVQLHVPSEVVTEEERGVDASGEDVQPSCASADVLEFEVCGGVGTVSEDDESDQGITPVNPGRDRPFPSASSSACGAYGYRSFP